jgi:hypothetical protein
VTVALQPDAYPELIQTFDACGYPVLDRVPGGWQPEAAPVLPATTPVRPVVQPLPGPAGRRRPHAWRGYASCRGSVRRPPRPGGAVRTGSRPAPGSAGCMRRGPHRRGCGSQTSFRPAWPTRSWKTG